MFLIYVVLNGMKFPCCPLLVCRTWQLQFFTSPSHSGRSSRTSGSVMQTLLVACAGPGQGCKGGWQQIFHQKMWQICWFFTQCAAGHSWPTFLGACFSCRCEFSTWVKVRAPSDLSQVVSKSRFWSSTVYVQDGYDKPKLRFIYFCNICNIFSQELDLILVFKAAALLLLSNSWNRLGFQKDTHYSNSM